jgi:hypothetical protein
LSRVSVLTSLDAEACEEVVATTGSSERLRRLSSEAHLLWADDAAQPRDSG